MGEPSISKALTAVLPFKYLLTLNHLTVHAGLVVLAELLLMLKLESRIDACFSPPVAIMSALMC